MDFLDISKIDYLFGYSVFVLPGFIIMKLIQLKVPNKPFLLKDVLFEAVSFSLFNLAVFGWIPYLVYRNGSAWWMFFFVMLLVVCPVLIALGYIKIIGSEWFQTRFDIQMPTAWDWYFSKRPNRMVRVKLLNGLEVIGQFDKNSYASSYPNEGTIYLARVYKQLSDHSLELVSGNDGVLIAKDQYSTIEFYFEGDAHGK